MPNTRAKSLLAVLILLASTLTLVFFNPSIARADTSYDFKDIAMSGSGQIAYVINANGSIWKTSDTGTTWSALAAAGTKNWSTIATSQDGSIVVAAVGSAGKLYVSVDAGVTWAERPGAGERNWRTVTISSDGTKIRAITSNTLKLYESNDTGINWSENATLPTQIVTGTNGCYSTPCMVPSWAELTMSGTANKIALLATAAGPYDSGRRLFISQDSGSTWVETAACCRDQSTVRQMASSRSDTNWTIMTGNYQSRPGYLRYDGSNWTRNELRVRESAGDSTNIFTTTWRGFAISADGDQVIFTGQYAGWEPSHAGKTQSLFTGSLSTQVSGVFQDDAQGFYYNDVAISDDGSVRAALKSSTGQYIVSTDSGLTFTRVKIFYPPLTPSLGSQIEYSDSYTVQVSNYDPSYTWTVTSTSGTASINGTGLVTVVNPVGVSTVTVATSKFGVPNGSSSFTARSLQFHVTATASWAPVNGSTPLQVFPTGSAIYDLRISPISGDLFVAGNFINAAGIGDADYIARFDGENWHALSGPTGGLSSGTSGGESGVFAIEFDSAGNLYAGGNFNNAGGVAAADNFARWNGTAWSSLGASSLNGSLRDIRVLNDGRVLVGGQFTDAGGISGANYVAAWDGSTWSKFGNTSLNNIVLAIEASKHGNVYISGHFVDAGGNSNADYVAKFDGFDWTSLGATNPAFNSPASAIAVDDRRTSETLYLGGSFWDGSKTQSLYMFQNGSWSAIDQDFTNRVRVLEWVDEYGLFVGGRFSTKNKFATGLGILNGSSWYGIGDSANNGSGTSSAFSSSVEAIDVAANGTVYVGGEFASAASQSNTRLLAKTSSWTPLVRNARVSEEKPGPSAEELERIRQAEERDRKRRSAWNEIIRILGSDSPITSSVAIEAGLEPLNEMGISLANSLFMAMSAETRTTEAFIQHVFTKSSLVQDLASEKPRENSVRKLIAFEILPSNMKYPSYTLYKIKKLPMEQRSDLQKIQSYVKSLQDYLKAREQKMLELKKKKGK